MGLTLGLILPLLAFLAIAFIIYRRRQQDAAEHTRGPLQSLVYEGEPDAFYDHETELQDDTITREFSDYMTLPVSPVP